MSKHFVILYLLIGILAALYDILVHGKPVVESLLMYLLFMGVGFMGCVSFFLHWRRATADKIAEGIGWRAGSPFQKEVAAADGAFGILGLACLWIHGDFWTATVFGAAFMFFFMGVGHVLDIKRNSNRSPLNAGSIVWFGLLFPFVLIGLWTFWKLGY